MTFSIMIQPAQSRAASSTAPIRKPRVLRLTRPSAAAGLGHYYAIVAALAVILGAIAITQLVLTMVLVAYPEQLDYGESIVYDHAARLIRGEPLYQKLDGPPYTVAAYTPLYYCLAGSLQAIAGPGFGTGRAVSILASLITAGLVAHLAAQQVRHRLAGPFAAVLFLALGLPSLYLWSALYRVDLLAVALSLGAITTLAGGAGPRRVMLAGGLVALALLTKQTAAAAALASFLWLWRRDRSQAVGFAGLVLAIVLATCLTLELATGAFLTNAVLANVNPFSLEALGPNLLVFALFQAGPLIVGLLYILDRVQVGTMVLEAEQGGRLLYVPRHDSGSQKC